MIDKNVIAQSVRYCLLSLMAMGTYLGFYENRINIKYKYSRDQQNRNGSVDGT